MDEATVRTNHKQGLFASHGASQVMAEPSPTAQRRRRSVTLTTNAETGKRSGDPPDGPENGDYRSISDELNDGEYVIMPERQGGPFDPAGTRRVDMLRARQLVHLVDALDGRWCMITLTIDRAEWVSPETAYDRCNERVREVARVVSRRGIHVAVVEMQTKTGDGWPHWHLLVYCPESRSREEIQHEVEKAWRIRTPGAVDEETGEVVTWIKQSIGISDVQVTRDRKAAARYIAKYINKRWEAHPAWMLNSYRQIRKFRFSKGVFAFLAERKLHIPKRGSRKPRTGRRRRRRLMVERLARSETQHIVFRKDAGNLKYAGRVGLPKADKRLIRAVLNSGIAEPIIDVGRRLAFRASGRILHLLRKIASDDAYQASADAFARNLNVLQNAWHELQRRREEAELHASLSDRWSRTEPPSGGTDPRL